MQTTIGTKPYGAAAGRKFGLTVGIAFGVFAGIAYWRGHPTTFAVLATIGGALVVAGLWFPVALRLVEAAWMKLALLISRVTTPVMMGVIYFVVLTPVGLLRRTLGKNPLLHAAGTNGHWADRSTNPKGSLEHLF